MIRYWLSVEERTGLLFHQNVRPNVHLCSVQEEADINILLHASDATSCGFERIITKSIDSDILVLLIAFCPQLSIEVWMKSGK